MAHGQHIETYVAFHSHGGTPKWLVYEGKSQSKMDDGLGYRHFRNPPYRLAQKKMKPWSSI